MEVTFKKAKLLGLIPVSMADSERFCLGNDELIFDFEARRVYLSSNESEDFAVIRTVRKKSLWNSRARSKRWMGT